MGVSLCDLRGAVGVCLDLEPRYIGVKSGIGVWYA